MKEPEKKLRSWGGWKKGLETSCLNCDLASWGDDRGTEGRCAWGEGGLLFEAPTWVEEYTRLERAFDDWSLATIDTRRPYINCNGWLPSDKDYKGDDRLYSRYGRRYDDDESLGNAQVSVDDPNDEDSDTEYVIKTVKNKEYAIRIPEKSKGEADGVGNGEAE